MPVVPASGDEELVQFDEGRSSSAEPEEAAVTRSETKKENEGEGLSSSRDEMTASNDEPQKGIAGEVEKSNISLSEDGQGMTITSTEAHSETTEDSDDSKDFTASEPMCFYLGVEDLEVQLPSKDHNYIDRQRQQQQQRCCPADVYICKVCGRSFEKRHRLVNHIRYVHCDWRPFLCRSCPAAFQSRSRLQRHVYVVHTKERPYRCDACGASFVDQFALNCHKRTHQADRPHRYFCELCGKGYHGLNPLKKHLLAHAGRPRGSSAQTVLCWVCGKAVASATYLKLHLKKHSPDTAITCAVCRQTFTSKQVLEKHLKSRVHQKRLDRKSAPAEEGGRTASAEGSDKGGGASSSAHRKPGAARTGAFQCEICEKSFSSPKSKKRHKRTIHRCESERGAAKIIRYFGQNPSEEEAANYTSLGPEGASSEVRGYPGEGLRETAERIQPPNAADAALSLKLKKPDAARKFTCDICFQPFSLQQSVRRHKRNVHFKRRDYRCEVCEKTFTDSYYLKQHKQAFHDPTGKVVRPTVKCDVCDKAFLAKSAMTMHKRTVHYGLRRQTCCLCAKRFRDKFTLERHQKSCRRERVSGQPRNGAARPDHDDDEEETGARVQPVQPSAARVSGPPQTSSSSAVASAFLSSGSAGAGSETSGFTGFHPVNPWAGVVPAFDTTTHSHAHDQLGMSAGRQLALASDPGTAAGALESVDLWNLG